jgi:hypothetical protein
MSARQPGVHVTSENDGTEVFKQASSDLQDLNLSGNKKSIECVGTAINHSQKLQLTAAHVLPKHSAPAAHAAAQLLGYRFRVVKLFSTFPFAADYQTWRFNLAVHV